MRRLAARRAALRPALLAARRHRRRVRGAFERIDGRVRHRVEQQLEQLRRQRWLVGGEAGPLGGDGLDGGGDRLAAIARLGEHLRVHRLAARRPARRPARQAARRRGRGLSAPVLLNSFEGDAAQVYHHLHALGVVEGGDGGHVQLFARLVDGRHAGFDGGPALA